MVSNSNLKSKLIVVLFTVGLIPFIFIGLFSAYYAGKALEQKNSDGLISVRDIKRKQVENYFNNLYIQIEIFARSIELQTLHTQLTKHHNNLKTSPTAPFNVTSAKYNKIYERYGRNFNQLHKESGYKDVYLICAEHGHVMYSSKKGKELGTNLMHGQYKESGLAKLWQKIKNTKNKAIVDFSPYAPDNNQPASFAGYPVLGINEEVTGVIAFQIPLKQINLIMQERTGLGKSAETYLVGKDKLMRSDSFLDPLKHSVKTSFSDPTKGKVETSAVNEALSGSSGVTKLINYKKTNVISAYTPVYIGNDITWALLSEINESEAFEFIESFKVTLLIAFFITVLIVTISALFLASALIRPVTQTTAELQTSSEELKISAQQQLSSTTEQAISTTQISTTMEELVIGSKQVLLTIKDVLNSADETFNAADKGNTSLGNAVEGMEQIKEQVKKIVDNMLALGQKTQQMGTALEIIKELSDQTTILSYNATIEAAGAGEKGLRFSAIAEQIMKLANKAMDSTKNIKIMIDDIQKSSNKSVLATEDGMKAVEEGRLRIKESEKHFNDIIMAAENNLTSTKEIDMTISQQAKAIEETSEGVKNVQIAAEEVKVSSNQVLNTAEQLMEMAYSLMNSYQSKELKLKNLFFNRSKLKNYENDSYIKTISQKKPEQTERII